MSYEQEAFDVTVLLQYILTRYISRKILRKPEVSRPLIALYDVVTS